MVEKRVVMEVNVISLVVGVGSFLVVEEVVVISFMEVVVTF